MICDLHIKEQKENFRSQKSLVSWITNLSAAVSETLFY